MDRNVEQMLEALRVTNPFGVETGRVTPASSATLAVARQNAERLARNPKWFARSGKVTMEITRGEMDALLAAGSPSEEINVLRSFRHEGLRTTFSDHCSNCQRWIYLGDSEHEGLCFCGKVYRVVFDRIPEDWSMRQGMVCMDCGGEWPSLVGSGANPQHRATEEQVQCDSCWQKSPCGPMRVRAGGLVPGLPRAT